MNTFSGETVLPANRITYMDTCQRECEWLIKDEITVGKFCRRLDDKEYAEYED
ncbi:MAG: hypothetical protein Q4G19_01730 [Clostridia bacterium]|nr:hypothetical protein [Clostridia bacterium]